MSAQAFYRNYTPDLGSLVADRTLSQFEAFIEQGKKDKSLSCLQHSSYTLHLTADSLRMVMNMNLNIHNDEATNDLETILARVRAGKSNYQVRLEETTCMSISFDVLYQGSTSYQEWTTKALFIDIEPYEVIEIYVFGWINRKKTLFKVDINPRTVLMPRKAGTPHYTTKEDSSGSYHTTDYN